jgi:SAM-dependent methyltransferase
MELLKIDLGCGKNKKEGFLGVDSISFPGVDIVADLRQPWPWKDNEVDEAHCSHFLEHLTADERIHFVNELDRVLKPGGKCTLICPHWKSCRAYGDPTHVWPPVSEFWFYYLSKEWRKANAPHTDSEIRTPGFKCDLECTWGYGLDPSLLVRNVEYQQHAMKFYTEATPDIIGTLKKKV